MKDVAQTACGSPGDDFGQKVLLHYQLRARLLSRYRDVSGQCNKCNSRLALYIRLSDSTSKGQDSPIKLDLSVVWTRSVRCSRCSWFLTCLNKIRMATVVEQRFPNPTLDQ